MTRIFANYFAPAGIEVQEGRSPIPHPMLPKLQYSGIRASDGGAHGFSAQQLMDGGVVGIHGGVQGNGSADGSLRGADGKFVEESDRANAPGFIRSKPCITTSSLGMPLDLEDFDIAFPKASALELFVNPDGFQMSGIAQVQQFDCGLKQQQLDSFLRHNLQTKR